MSKLTEQRGAGHKALPPLANAPKGKLGALVALLSRPQGATLAEMQAATGWQAHSVRGAMSGALRKQRGLVVLSEKREAARTYKLAGGGQQ